jgi:hypothetical protein
MAVFMAENFVGTALSALWTFMASVGQANRPDVHREARPQKVTFGSRNESEKADLQWRYGIAAMAQRISARNDRSRLIRSMPSTVLTCSTNLDQIQLVASSEPFLSGNKI